MLIGEFSKRVGLPPSTIRYYEKEGLLRGAARKSGRRIFDSDDILAAQILVQARALGFRISELRNLATLLHASDSSGGGIKYALSNRLNRVDSEINQLTAMRDRLRRMLACDCSELSVCLHVAS